MGPEQNSGHFQEYPYLFLGVAYPVTVQPVEEALGQSFRDWSEMQPGSWPPTCHEGRERERGTGNLPSKDSSKIWIHRAMSTSQVLFLDHSTVSRPFQAGLILLQCACSEII